MDLSKVHIFQESDSNTCGPCCLAMIYGLKGKDISLDDILKDFRHPKKGKPTYVPQLANHLNKHGLKTKILISTSKVLSPAWKNLSKDKIIENLKAWILVHKRNPWSKDVKFLLQYLQGGGDSEQISYGAQTIKEMLERGSLVLLCVDEDWIWGHRFKKEPTKRVIDDIAGKVEGHFVVVTGYKDHVFHVLDPFPTNIDNRHGEYDIDMSQLINASLTWDAEVIEIFK